MTTDMVNSPNKGFEEIKHIDENGTEYWSARELFPLLGYSTWQAFDELVNRGARAALNSGQVVENHFSQLTKMVDIGSGSRRAVKDWKLDRYACYLIAQNGDPKIAEIALAQTYFAVQTRRQELFDKLPDAEKRLFIRGEVVDGNKKLFRTAKEAGVSNFGLFNDAGYRGLYGTSASNVEAKKGIKKGELLDRAGATELAANLFRITQTDEKLKKDDIKTENAANRAHFMVGGKVRQTIKDIGGRLPEDLKPETHIKKIKKEMKLLEKEAKKAALPAKKKKSK
ncbi:MAG: damage-inducible protein [Candidatus Nomurabacteria bacterium]|jgi:DNA-damage-inducible protein D|nr:damage-inducible protein [Candidatus Nomurabacteria bacterium]